MNFTLTVSSQGQIVIPIKVRQTMGLKPGSKISLTLDRVEPVPTVILQPEPKSWVERVSGLGKGIWGKGEVYIAKERRTWDRG